MMMIVHDMLRHAFAFPTDQFPARDPPAAPGPLADHQEAIAGAESGLQLAVAMTRDVKGGAPALIGVGNCADDMIRRVRRVGK